MYVTSNTSNGVVDVKANAIKYKVSWQQIWSGHGTNHVKVNICRIDFPWTWCDIVFFSSSRKVELVVPTISFALSRKLSMSLGNYAKNESKYLSSPLTTLLSKPSTRQRKLKLISVVKYWLNWVSLGFAWVTFNHIKGYDLRLVFEWGFVMLDLLSNGSMVAIVCKDT